MARVIRFYSTRGEFGGLSNFAAFPIWLKGAIWPTSEHYFQAQKFAGTEHEEAIRLAPTAARAASMGRDRRRPLRNDWEAAKDRVMRECVLAKFQQHSDLRNLLLSTGDAQIVESASNDSYWGDGGAGSGLNMLGRILMEIRDQLHAGMPTDSFGLAYDPATPAATNPMVPLRRVRYTRHEFHRETVVREDSLLVFIYDVPYLGARGVVPPFRLLNAVLNSGGSDGGMSPGATWKPFQLSLTEYDQLTEAIRSSPFNRLRRRARFAGRQFTFDDSLDHINDYQEWVEAVCDRHQRNS
jgi:ribA/ribD-fused uncharacterized protein